MLTYRATLRPRSATRTPWQADTLFGHLCWLIRYEEGAASLAEFLEAYRAGEPPLLISNGFPADFLPRPMLPGKGTRDRLSKGEQIAEMRQAKQNKDIRWATLEEFNRLRADGARELSPKPNLKGDRTILKNQINRLTFGTTPPEGEEGGGGNLYNADELAFVDKSKVKWVGQAVAVYVRVPDERGAERAEELLGWLAQSGYGAKKSVGYGQFELAEWARFPALDEAVAGANGFISLSNWVPAAGDPSEGFYGRLVKYGKLGEEWATAGRPFKYPLIMLRAGSSFYDRNGVKAWYGRLVENIAPDNREVVQYGYALAVPAKLGAD